jgi:DNA-binding phage protein
MIIIRKQSAIERAQQVVERMGNMSTLAEEMMTNTTLAPREGKFVVV